VLVITEGHGLADVAENGDLGVGQHGSLQTRQGLKWQTVPRRFRKPACVRDHARATRVALSLSHGFCPGNSNENLRHPALVAHHMLPGVC
jgi:hypothetical protein